MSLTPKESLELGANILLEYLDPLGFKFEIITIGRGSGGHFACGQFISNDKIIEVHYRSSLGLVSYKVDNIVLSHEDYIDLVFKHGQNKYPDFSLDKQESFLCLLSDLKILLTDFTENNAFLLRRSGPEILEKIEKKHIAYNREASGDLKLIHQAKNDFKNGSYHLVNGIKKQLKYPSFLTASEERMFDISYKKNQDKH